MTNPGFSKKTLIFTVLMTALALPCAALNSATITAATLKALPYCLHYKVKGACYWSGVAGVSITPYVEYYSPDVVVTVFNQAGENPWTEINATVDKAGEALQKPLILKLTGFAAGSGQHSFSDEQEKNVFFKEADIIGNPALAVLPEYGYALLPSTAKPLHVYYQSLLDSAMWRGILGPASLAEETFALGANVLHHVGVGLINWGGVYPHEGKIATSNDAKAAAVIAQRAGDLLTASDLTHLTGHIYQGLSQVCGEHCQAAPITENASCKTQFQLIYPVENERCEVFGSTAAYGNAIETQTKGAYAWIIWRFYQGCADGDGKFIGKTLVN